MSSSDSCGASWAIRADPHRPRRRLSAGRLVALSAPRAFELGLPHPPSRLRRLRLSPDPALHRRARSSDWCARDGRRAQGFGASARVAAGHGTALVTSSRLLYYSDRGVLRLDGLREDDVTKGTPEIRVLAGTGTRPRLVFESIGPHLPLAYRQVGRSSPGCPRGPPDRRNGHRRARYRCPPRRRPVLPRTDGGPAGAVVSAASLAQVESAHIALIATIAIGCGVLSLCVGGRLPACRSQPATGG